MLIPRYYFADDFADFYEIFLKGPHEEKVFPKGSFLWSPGEPFTRVFYLQSGIAQTLVQHENGAQKIQSFHGAGTIFPVPHRLEFKIEQSIATRALLEVKALSFTKSDFLSMTDASPALCRRIIDWYAAYVNLLIYEGAHQEYNPSFLKLCNLLYLFCQNSKDQSPGVIDLTQENIADILTISRVNAARGLLRLRDEGIIVPHRKWIEVVNLSKLASYCSQETLLPEDCG